MAEHTFRELVVAVAWVVTGGVLVQASREHIAIGPWPPAGRAAGSVLVLRSRDRQPVGGAVLIHGLAANRGVMLPLAEALAASGWQVYLPDLAGHGSSRASFGYEKAEQDLRGWIAELDAAEAPQLRPQLIVGHSLGGALAVRLGGSMRIATIALAPAPMVLPKQWPPALLVVTGQQDLPWILDSTAQLAARMRRTASTQTTPCRSQTFYLRWATHASVLVDPRVWRLVAEWARCAQGAGSPCLGDLLWCPLSLLGGAVSGLVGFLLLVAIVLRPQRRTRPRSNPVGDFLRRRASLWVRWGLALVLAVCAVGWTGADRRWAPVGLQDGDWLAWVGGLAGMFLLVSLPGDAVEGLAGDWSLARILVAVLVAAALVAGVAGWLRWCLLMSWSSLRLLRLVVLAVYLFPYFLAEEAVLARESAATRRRMFWTLRGIAWLALVFSVWVFWSAGVILILLTVELALVGLLQRWVADRVLQRGWGVPAAAVVTTLLAASTVAAVLPLRP